MHRLLALRDRAVEEGVLHILMRRVARGHDHAGQPHLVAHVQRTNGVVSDRDIQVDDGHGRTP